LIMMIFFSNTYVEIAGRVRSFLLRFCSAAEREDFARSARPKPWRSELPEGVVGAKPG
jgi:hypothetical protein